MPTLTALLALASCAVGASNCNESFGILLLLCPVFVMLALLVLLLVLIGRHEK
jgi:hypothetical protein